MQYKEIHCDLFTVAKDYYLAHCISADFGMGKGIAVMFNKLFNMKKRLIAAHPNYLNRFVSTRMGADCLLEGNVLNLITKEHYWDKPTNITMHLALKRMKEICLENNITKIAMPKIGAGLDKLDWWYVSRLIQHTFEDTDIEILVCIL